MPRQHPQTPLSAASMRKPRPVSAPVSTGIFSSAAAAHSGLGNSSTAAAGGSSFLSFSRHIPSSSPRHATVRPSSAVASNAAAVVTSSQPLNGVVINGGHMTLASASNLQQQRPSAATLAPARVAVRAASAPRVLASSSSSHSSRPGVRATSAPRRAHVKGDDVAGEDEEEEGVTIDDGDGDGGEEVFLAMGNAINRWGRDKGNRKSKGLTVEAKLESFASAEAPLASSVMAKMGLLPDSMLQRTMHTLLVLSCSYSRLLFSSLQNNLKRPPRPFLLQRRRSSTHSTAPLQFP